MRRLNVVISDDSDKTVADTKKKEGFTNRDETVEYIIQQYGKTKK